MIKLFPGSDIGQKQQSATFRDTATPSSALRRTGSPAGRHALRANPSGKRKKVGYLFEDGMLGRTVSDDPLQSEVYVGVVHWHILRLMARVVDHGGRVG